LLIAIETIVFIALVYRTIRLELKLKQANEKLIKLLSQKKSSEVITGQIAEKMAPFLENFKHNPQQSIFCGQPIDYIVFGDDEVTFVEIKSGNARLTSKQRYIKKQIQNKQVGWEEIRIK
jgi:predicted Holliday junction resolvase-like endonuclease